MERWRSLSSVYPREACRNPPIEMFRKAGFNIHVSERSYFPDIDDGEIECILIRAQEITP